MTKNRYKVLTPTLGMYWVEKPPIQSMTREYVILNRKRIDPIFSRNGHYYDRKLKFSWFEFSGEAYILDDYSKYKSNQFHWFFDDIRLAERANKRLDKDAIEPIRKLIKLGLASKEQIDMLEDDNIIEKRGLHAKDVRYRFLKFCKGRNIKITIKVIPLP
jgi:hypothetical protein